MANTLLALPPPLGRVTSSRDASSDRLKAAAIIAVVGIHVGLPYASVLRFCVPVFIALWAYHFELSLASRPAKQTWHYAGQRLRRLFLPYLFWTLAYLALFHRPADWTHTPIHTILGGWFGGYGWAGQYFLLILFQWTCILPLIRRRLNLRAAASVLLVGVALNVCASHVWRRLPFVASLNDRLFIYWIPYVMLGMILARWPVPRVRLAAGLAMTCLALSPFELAHAERAGLASSPYLLITITAGSILLVLSGGPRAVIAGGDSASLSMGRAPRVWLYVGRHSYVIFLAHPLFIYLCEVAGLRSASAALELLARIGTLTIAVVGSLLLGAASRRLGVAAITGA